jgi:hypothetical protein
MPGIILLWSILSFFSENFLPSLIFHKKSYFFRLFIDSMVFSRIAYFLRSTGICCSSEIFFHSFCEVYNIRHNIISYIDRPMLFNHLDICHHKNFHLFCHSFLFADFLTINISVSQTFLNLLA